MEKIEIKQSSVIKGLEYDFKLQILQITFNKNVKYEYYGVSEDLVRQFVNADSLGEFFNEVLWHWADLKRI